jgi:hypothetical protein
MIEHHRLDQAEVTQIIAILNRENWVQLVKYPGMLEGEIGVETKDGKAWRIEKPLDLVRLKYHYRSAS